MIDELKHFTLWLRWFFSFSRDDFDVFIERIRQERRESPERSIVQDVAFPTFPSQGLETSREVEHLEHEDDTESVSESDEDFEERLKTASDFTTLIDLFVDLCDAEHPLVDEVFKRLLPLTDSADKAIQLFEGTPPNSSYEEESVLHFTRVAASLEEQSDFLLQFELSAALRGIVEASMVRICEYLLANASTLEDCFNLSERSQDLDFSQEFYVSLAEKALTFAQTQEDCDQILEVLFDTSEPPDTPVEEAVHLKKISFLDSVGSCAEIWDEQSIDSTIGEAAICRAADIIRSRSV